MRPITIPRSIAILVVAVLASLTEEIGPNRFWLSGVLAFGWVPFMIWRDTWPEHPDEEWHEVFLNVLFIVVVVHLAPAMWHVAAIVGAMIVQAPTTVVQPRGVRLYTLLAGTLITGLAISGYVHNPPLWKLTLGCMLGMYPAILLFAHWQAQRHIALRTKAGALDSVRLMAGGVAHDFNNYLTGILGNAELARTEIREQANPKTSEVTYQALDNLVQGADKARGLARQLLSFSRAESQRHVTLDLGVELASLTELLRSVEPSRSQLSFQNNDSQPASLVSGSPVQLQQLFMNLILNAQESADGDVVVNVGLERVQEGTERYLVVSVTDNGDGLAEDIRQRIFEPFVSTKDSGYGLGLAAAKEIVDAHGGSIEIESNAGQGTRVSVTLPAADHNAS